MCVWLPRNKLHLSMQKLSVSLRLSVSVSVCLSIFVSLSLSVCLSISSFSAVPATSICKARLVLIRLRRLELIAIYVIEASVPTIILFCVKSAKMLLIYINGRRFGPVAFISTRFRMSVYLSLCLCLSVCLPLSLSVCHAHTKWARPRAL